MLTRIFDNRIVRTALTIAVILWFVGEGQHLPLIDASIEQYNAVLVRGSSIDVERHEETGHFEAPYAEVEIPRRKEKSSKKRESLTEPDAT